MSSQPIDPAAIRASLDHPVVDADGHLVEYWPEFDRWLKAEGIDDGMAAFMATANFDGSRLWQGLAPAERARERAFRGPWWGFPNDARDLATAMAPRLGRAARPWRSARSSRLCGWPSRSTHARSGSRRPPSLITSSDF